MESALKVVCKLDELMRTRKITAKMISDKTGITPAAISNLRTNKNRQVQFDTVELLCEYFNCNVGDLFVVEKRK